MSSCFVSSAVEGFQGKLVTNSIYSALPLSGSLPLLLSKKNLKRWNNKGVCSHWAERVLLCSQASVQLGRGVIDGPVLAGRQIERVIDMHSLHLNNAFVLFFWTM